MTQPSDAAGYERLVAIFDRAHKERVYRVRFDDGEEYEITAVWTGQDFGEPPHRTANVLRTVRSRDGKPFPPDGAMFFLLPHVLEVADARTGEILYRAV